MGDQSQVNQMTASWFFEEFGQQDAPLVGPYRADEILKFVMDGTLKVESRIYNAERDEWMAAADVASAPPPPPAGPAGWQPPPRPAELRDVHVVKSVTGDTGLIDYFALINRPSRGGPAGAAGSQGKRHAPMRAAERAVAAASKESLNEESVGASHPGGKFDVGFDVPKGLSSASGYIARFGMILKRHQRALYYAAAVVFVAAGAFGVVQYFGQKGREPATTANTPTAAAANASKAAAAKTENLKLSSGSTLGTGSNKVARPSGGVTGASTQTTSSGAPYSAGGYPPQPDQRNASPQYYSSSEDSMRSVTGHENTAPPPPAAYPPPVDPNHPVNPPGYFQPAGSEATLPPDAGGGYAPPPHPEGPATY